MVYTLNEQDFADPISRRLARGEPVGAKSQIWLDPRGRECVSFGNGGIADPVRYDLAPESLVYRFGSASDGAEGVMRGGWWLERRELDILIRYANLHDRSLGYAVRKLCCVPPEWGSALNFLIAAKTVGPVAAWRGLPASAGASFTLKPGMSRAAAGTTYIEASDLVTQLFIPGTRRAGSVGGLLRFEGQWQTEGAADWIFGSS